MEKINVLKYDPPYGGQSFKKIGPKYGFSIFMDFVSRFTIPTDETEMELKIFEENNKKLTNYASAQYIKNASELFGMGKRIEWLNNTSDPHHNEYCFEWKISEEKFETCINFLEEIKPFPKYYIGPIQISISYWFKWKKYNYGKELFISDFFSMNHINLFLSKTNSIILDLNFPNELINTKFIDFYNNILEILPVELPVKRFRHYLPTKDEKNYRIKKLTTEELEIFNELIGKAKTSA